MRKKMSNTSKLAFGGIIAAVSVALMMLTGIIPFSIYLFPIIAGYSLLTVVLECGKSWAVSVYIAVSILSLLFIADKESAVLYAFFFGYYPIIKPVIEGKLRKIPQWIVKFLIFNISLAAAYSVLIILFSLDISSGRFPLFIVLTGGAILANFLFLVYDLFFTRIVTIYLKTFSNTVKKIFYH